MCVGHMNLYCKAGQLFALYIEVDREYGYKPFLKWRNYEGEKILDLPYSRVIFTPRSVLKHSRKKKQNLKQ
jgi:hypothetical protein